MTSALKTKMAACIRPFVFVLLYIHVAGQCSIALAEASDDKVDGGRISKQREALSKKVEALKKREIKIEVNGVEKELRKNILAHLSVDGSVDEAKALSAAEIKRLSIKVEEEVQEGLQSFGYYNSEIKIHLDSEDQWRLSIDVQPRERVELRDVQLGITGEGADAAELSKVRDESALYTGAALSHKTYEHYKAALQRTAYSLGYLDAQFLKHELRVYPEDNVADVFLEFDTGQRYFFGPITIQQDILNPDFLEKFIKPKADDPFESDRLLDLQLALNETNYFSHVSVDVQQDDSKGFHIPIVVEATPRKAAKYDFSGGYGTDTGLRGGIFVNVRRVNRKGHRSKNKLELSTLKSSLASKYFVPIGDVSSEYLGFNAEIEQEKVNEVDVVEYSISSSLNQNRGRGRRRLGLELSHENWSFGDQPSQSSTLLIPSIDFTTKHSDDPFFIRRGYSAALRLQGAVENVLSDVSFAQVHLHTKVVRSLTKKARLLMRVELGATVVDEFEGLPPSLRFFAGGSQSVRGYGYKDLSPTNAAGDRIGGKYLTVISTELDYLLTDTLGVAAFVDAGDATRQPLDSLKLGAGLGFRYKSPVGMLRIDVAHPFDNPDENFRVHLSFGIDL